MGLGGAFVTLSDDATAICWNPAGVGQLRKPELATATIGNPLGMGDVLGSAEGLSEPSDRHQFVSYVHPFGRYGSAGIGVVYFRLGEIEQRDENGDSLGVFSDYENAYILTYGLELAPGQLFAGLDLKVIRQTFSGFGHATGFGGDIGLIYLPMRGVKLGFSSQKKTTLEWENGHSDEIPVRSRVGLSYSLPMTVTNLTFASDINQKSDRSLKANVGLEFDYSPGLYLRSPNGFGVARLSLRAGVSDLAFENRYGPRGDPEPSFGAGIVFGTSIARVKIDYGVNFGYFGLRHRYGFGMVF